MKLRNKRTGEAGYLTAGRSIDHYVVANNEWVSCGKYDSLAELNEEWEDYEEPKEYWYIDISCTVKPTEGYFSSNAIDILKEAGNCFETKEEAERAVEKLKAWKRLKDKGFRFEGIKQDYTRFFSQQKPIRIGRKYLQFNKAEDEEWLKENCEDLDLLFGGEE